MDCTAALHRLNVGVPATVEHNSEEGNETAKWVAETTQNFITFMDALKLKLRAKDQLQPLLTELMSGYTRFKASNDWEGRPKILHWYEYFLLKAKGLCDLCVGFHLGLSLSIK
jgi:ESCRT-I complex subunit VPS28